MAYSAAIDEERKPGINSPGSHEFDLLDLRSVVPDMRVESEWVLHGHSILPRRAAKSKGNKLSGGKLCIKAAGIASSLRTRKSRPKRNGRKRVRRKR